MSKLRTKNYSRFILRNLAHYGLTALLGIILVGESVGATPNADLLLAQQPEATPNQAIRAKAERLTIEGIKLFEQGTPESRKQAISKWQEALILWRKFDEKKTQAIITTGIGNAYLNLGDKQQALKFYNQALLLSQEVGYKSGQATNLLNIGNVYSDLGDKQQALNFYNQALPLLQEIGDKDRQAITLLSIGKLHSDLEDKQQAFKLFNQALLLYRELNNNDGEATTLHNIGSVYSDLGKKQQALKFYNQALPLRRKVGNKSGEAATLSNIGAIYNYLGNNQQALKFYNQALPLMRKVGDKSGEATTLNNIGSVYSDLGDKQQALKFFNQALLLSQEVEDKSGEARTLNNIGAVYNYLGNNQQALKFHNQALLLHRKVKEKNGEATNLLNIGGVYSDLGDNQQAFKFYNQALLLYQEVKNKSGEARTLNNIGKSYSDLGDKQQALKFYNQALPLSRSVKDKSGEATNLLNIGQSYSDLGDKQQALKFHNQALLLYQEVEGKNGEAVTLLNIGTVYYSLEDKQQALKFYNQALPLLQEVGDKAGQATNLSHIAKIYRDNGNLKTALTNSQAAIKIIEELRTKVDSNDLRTSYFATVQDIYKLYIDVLMQLHKQNPSKAYDAQALAASEKSRARGLLELLTEANADIRKGANPELLAQEKQFQQLIDSKEKLRLEIVNDKNKSNDLISKAAVQKLEKEIENHLNEYKQLQVQIKQSNPKYANLKYPEPLKLPQIQQQLDRDSLLLQYSLGDDRSYLWLVSHNSLDVYELPKKSEIEKASINLFCLISQNSSKPPSATGKENPCEDQKNIFTRRIDLAAAELSKLVVAPVKDKLGKKRLVVVADGALQYIPFAALADLTPQPPSLQGNGEKEKEKLPSPRRRGAGGEVSARGGLIPEADNLPSGKNFNYQPLLVNHEIVNLPSASTIAIQRQELANRKRAPKTLAILADPVFSATDKRDTDEARKQLNKQNYFDIELERSALKRSAETFNRKGWTRLLGTRAEAETIKQLVPDGDRLAVFDFDANYNWATSKALNQFRILHFATHGFVNDENPELSGIVLSLVDKQGKDIRGYLRLGDLFNLDYPADLIVLSACETGLGKDIQGEGLVGLTRGLMYAGGERLVVSLWQVDDQGTAAFMQEFYKQMLQEGKSASEALRATQLKMWSQEKWRNPNYWAAFAFLGEWK